MRFALRRKPALIESVFDPDACQETFAARIHAPAPDATYCILFTPRSGSSWLSNVLTRTRVMGSPNEWFNPELMPKSTRALGARNLDQFIAAISRHRAFGRRFGFEMTFHQLSRVFGTPEAFMARFSAAQFFWLLREDIVAQGVSLHKMVQTKVCHSAGSEAAVIDESDSRYSYKPREIRRWIEHIRAAETGTEAMVSGFGLSPVRLSYERNMALGAAGVTGLFARHMGLKAPPAPTAPTEDEAHQKIGTAKNTEFAARFREEHRDYLHRLTDARAGLLSRLD